MTLEEKMRVDRDRAFAEGEAQGEAKKNLDNARKMKAKGYDTAEIADITGLTIEEIEKL